MSGKVLVSVASQGRENYNKAQLALIRSSVQGAKWTGDYLIRSVDGYVDKYDGVAIRKGWPITNKYGTSWQHADMPYQFKPFAVWEAYEAGYTKILWCDSTMRIMRNPDPLWDKCAEHGILAWNNEGHPLAPWISDYAIEQLDCDVSEMKQIMACCIMFDFSHPKTLPIVEAWIQGSLNNSFHPSSDGSSRPEFKANRHDQAYLSALLNIHGVEIQPYGELAYPHHTPIEPYFVNWGVKD